MGVVIADSSGYEGSLTARRLDAMADDPSLHEVLGVRVVLETVSEEALEPGLRDLRVVLPAPVGSFTGRVAELAAAPLLENTRHRWLVVLDNADNVRVLDGLVPRAGTGQVLTSRRGDWAALGATVRRLDVLPPRDAVALLSFGGPVSSPAHSCR